MLEPGGDSFAVVIQLTGTTGSLTQVQGSLPYCEGNARMSKQSMPEGEDTQRNEQCNASTMS